MFTRLTEHPQNKLLSMQDITVFQKGDWHRCSQMKQKHHEKAGDQEAQEHPGA